MSNVRSLKDLDNLTEGERERDRMEIALDKKATMKSMLSTGSSSSGAMINSARQKLSPRGRRKPGRAEAQRLSRRRSQLSTKQLKLQDYSADEHAPLIERAVPRSTKQGKNSPRNAAKITKKKGQRTARSSTGMRGGEMFEEDGERTERKRQMSGRGAEFRAEPPNS